MHIFEIKPRICFGDKSLELLQEIREENVVIVTDDFMQRSGAVDKVSSYIKNCGKIHVFADIIPDPPIELIVKALEYLERKNADLVVALGGGSSIDAAKATILMYQKKTGKKIPLYAIPTTSGTGSEVTKFSVITDRQEGKKYPLVSDDLLPEVAILSSDLTLSVPANITANTGFDVITHALEAYISTGANDITDALAEKALELSFKYLPRACKDGMDSEAREKMHTASCLAGMAFNDAGLGVNHGIAHALGAVFHIPHGCANAMMLYHVMMYNAGLDGIQKNSGTPSVACSKMAKISRVIGMYSFSDSQGAMSLLRTIKTMSQELGIPQTLADVGVTEAQYNKFKNHIIDSAVNDACTVFNPRKIDAAAVAKILKGIETFKKEDVVRKK